MVPEKFASIMNKLNKKGQVTWHDKHHKKITKMKSYLSSFFYILLESMFDMLSRK